MRQANRLLITVLCFILSSLAYGDRDKDNDEGRETSCSIPRHVVHDVQASFLQSCSKTMVVSSIQTGCGLL